MTGRGVAIFRVVTIWTTLALVVFVMWIFDGASIARWIASGLLLLGFLQWWVLRRFSRHVADDAETAVAERTGTR